MTRLLDYAIHDANLEQLRPPLPGDEEPVIHRVVGDAVEDIGVRALAWRQQAVEIDVAGDSPRVGRDARDVVGLPDVREDLSLRDLELVQTPQRRAAGRHRATS